MPVNNSRVSVTQHITTQIFTDATMAGAQWDYQGSIWEGALQDGKFQTDSEETDETTRILLSGKNTAGTESGYIVNVGVGNFIRFTNINGETVVFLITRIDPGENGSVDIGVQIQGGHSHWLGRYVIDFQPGTGF